MKTFNLFKLTTVVIIVTLASSFINADDSFNTTMQITETEMIQIEEQVSFSALVDALDTDQDGMLSPAEVSASQSELFQQEFTNIDTNQDQQIDKAEFDFYLSEVKRKVTYTIARNNN